MAGVKLKVEQANLSVDARRLTEWYEREQRDLPWRRTRDAYSIWVSETMLQQTRVETVIPYYFAFLEKFPTVTALADADFEEVAKLWQGLGYYSRARNLHKAAQVIERDFGGRVPDDLETFRSLPGVGPYTAGAVMSIAFDRSAPAVDGNVLRVITRYLGIREPIELPSTKKAVTDHVDFWLQSERPRSFTQALMELGAMVCIPKRPRCEECPIRDNCVARAEDLTEVIPARKPKAAKREVDVFAFWLESNGYVLMQKRPDEGLLAGMWQLPAVETLPKSGNAELLARECVKILRAANLVGVEDAEDVDDVEDVGDVNGALGAHVAEAATTYEAARDEMDFAPLAQERHIFTHLAWTVQVVRPVGLELGNPEDIHLPANFRFVPHDEILQLVLPRVYEKLINQILGEV